MVFTLFSGMHGTVSSEIAFRFRLLEIHGWRQPKHPHKASEPFDGSRKWYNMQASLARALQVEYHKRQRH